MLQKQRLDIEILVRLDAEEAAEFSPKYQRHLQLGFEDEDLFTRLSVWG